MHLPPQISDLALILGVAALVTYLFQKINQPVVLGYLLAGVIVGPYTPTGLNVTDLHNVKVWGELGVIFLMFALGLEFTFRKLIRVGVPAAGTAVVEVILMVSCGFAAGQLLGWNKIDSIFLGGILSISSTTIILKAFEGLGVKSRRFAEIVFGVLIVEDLVAILLLVALSTVALTQSIFSTELLVSAAKLILVVGSWFLLGYFLIPTFLRRAGKKLENEFVVVLSTALCLGLTVVATYFHYSAALGAFIMGSILGETVESHRIESLIQPLRDLFAAVFFVSVGMLVDPKVLIDYAYPIALITVLTIVGKIVSSTAGAVLTGQPLKRSVQIGFSLAQIGEFSFIIATLGSTLKVTSDFLYPIAVTTSVVTTFTTPYLVKYSDRAAALLERMLPGWAITRLAGYSAWAQNPRSGDLAQKWNAKQLLRFFANLILVTVVFLAMWEFGLPHVSSLMAWVGSVILAAPFVWGMFFAFRSKTKARRKNGRITAYGLYQFLSQLATLLWLGLLSSLFLPLGASMLLTLSLGAVLFFMLYRKLEQSYRWFEKRFMENVKEGGRDRAAKSTALAPWDVHTVRMKVHQNSALVGRAIKQEQIRKKHGLNIVAIQRGSKFIASPAADEILYPNDELLLLGSDEQIDLFRALAELPSGDVGDGKTLDQYALRRVLVEPGSSYIGQTIRGSGVRANLKGLIVGVERADFRTINPDPDWELQPNDVLWVVSVS